MKMKQFTEEELAAYIDGTLPEFRMHDLESSLTDDTLELIGVTRAALGMVAEDGVEPVTEEAEKSNVVRLPDWESRKPSSHVIIGNWNAPIAMAGFLGDDEDEDEDDVDVVGPDKDDRK